MATQWFHHPDWTGEETLQAFYQGVDIGLIRLDTPVTSITPAELYQPSDGSEVGRFVYMVGYGNTGTGLTGYEPDTIGYKRAGSNMIDYTGNFFLNPVPDYPYDVSENLMWVDFDSIDGDQIDIYGGDPTPMDLEGIIAPGDSGGGTFIEVDGVWKLAGIHSFVLSVGLGNQPDSNYGDLAAMVRVSQYVDWISMYVPEPGTAMLLPLAGAMLLRRSRRHS